MKMPVILSILLYLCIVMLPHVLVQTALVKFDVHRELAGAGHIGFVLVTSVMVDDQQLRLLVDTGSQYTFAVWKTWYEASHPGGCNVLMYKCYECNPPPCTKGPTINVKFADGAEADIFQHSGSLDIHQLGKKVINFGLISKYTSPLPIHAGLGLGPPTDSIEPYTPILQQLRDALPSTAFSLYLKPGDKPSGQLILGGQDPSLYEGPLRILDFDESYEVELTGFRVGVDSYPKDETLGEVEIDTGAEGFWIPRQELKMIIEYLRTRGTKVVEIKEVDKSYYEVACADVKYLPSVTLFLKDEDGEDIPLVFNPDDYVLPPASSGKGICVVHVSESKPPIWVLGYNLLVGRYIYFDYDQKKIGIAKLQKA